jgi:mono/diheme cytochrome c family protein
MQGGSGKLNSITPASRSNAPNVMGHECAECGERLGERSQWIDLPALWLQRARWVVVVREPRSMAMFTATSRRVATGATLALVVAIALGLPAAAQDGSVSYSSMQWRQGSLLYRDNCASCHGDRLQGALEAPALSGDDFESHWFGQPLSALYEYTTTKMPQDRPGALAPDEYARITAFILHENDIESNGDENLPSDPAALGQMVLPAAE